MEDDLNKSKCRVVHMTHKKTCACLPTCMREVPLVPTNTRKHLGVQLASNLDWGTACPTVSTKVNRSLGLLQRHLKHCSPSIKETVVEALVRPQMDYCSSAWNPNEKVDVATLEKVQCRAARYVKNDYRRNPVSRK